MKNNILILNNHGLGDVVMSFTFFENLLKVSNNARIIILFKSKLELELFTLTQLYRDNESKFLLYNIKNIKKLFLYIFRIKKAYSLGVDEDKSKKLFKLLFVKDFYIANPYNYEPSHTVNILNNENKIHKSILYSNLVKLSFDINILMEDKDYFIQDKEDVVYQNYIVFTGGSGELEKHKRWTTLGYKNLLINIIDNSNYKIFFVGSQSEQKIVDEILFNIENKYLERVTQLNGKTSLLELINILRNSELVVGNDNGVMHIASACFANVLGLFGSTNYKITGPIGDNIEIIENRIECSPCYAYNNIEGCEDNICMKMITSGYVYKKVENFLNDVRL
jgi:ADP-heptose:LPS heptosyltransferase